MQGYPAKDRESRRRGNCRRFLAKKSVDRGAAARGTGDHSPVLHPCPIMVLASAVADGLQDAAHTVRASSPPLAAREGRAVRAHKTRLLELGLGLERGLEDGLGSW